MLFGYLFVLPTLTGQKLFCPSTDWVRLTLKLLEIQGFDNKKFSSKFCPVNYWSKISWTGQRALPTRFWMRVVGIGTSLSWFPAIKIGQLRISRIHRNGTVGAFIAAEVGLPLAIDIANL